MRVSMSKSVVARVTAVVLLSVASLATVPADAAFRMGGGGFHGGGFGGWRGGYAGYGYRGYGYRGYGYRGYGYGGWWWPGFATGALIGATYPYWGGYYGYPYYDYGYDYGYPYYGYPYAAAGYSYGAGNGNGCLVYRRVYNRYGHYIGRHLVDVCH